MFGFVHCLRLQKKRFDDLLPLSLCFSKRSSFAYQEILEDRFFLAQALIFILFFFEEFGQILETLLLNANILSQTNKLRDVNSTCRTIFLLPAFAHLMATQQNTINFTCTKIGSHNWVSVLRALGSLVLAAPMSAFEHHGFAIHPFCWIPSLSTHRRRSLITKSRLPWNAQKKLTHYTRGDRRPLSCREDLFVTSTVPGRP